MGNINFDELLELTMDDWVSMNLPPIEFLKTSYDNFDNIVGGIAKSQITILSAFSGNGKSMVSTHLASALSKNYKVCYISIENIAQIDIERFKQAITIYDGVQKNVMYFNAMNGNCIDLSLSDIRDVLIYAIEKCECDCVIVDGAELLFDGADEGGQMYAAGNLFMKQLISIISKTNKGLVMTWQLNREASNKKDIEDLNTGYIANSMGVVRYASQVYAIKKYKDDWNLKIIKSRTEIYNEEKISLRDKDGKFSLKGGIVYSKSDEIKAKNLLDDLYCKNKD